MLYRQAIGHEIRLERVAQGKSLRELSSSAPMSLSYLSEVERGQKELSSELAESVSLALGIRPSELLLRASLTMITEETREILQLEKMYTDSSELTEVAI